MAQSCTDCAQRSDRVFCDIERPNHAELDELKSLGIYPLGTILCQEGTPARSVFLVCHGRLRLSISSEGGRKMVVGTASDGDVIGLGAALSAGCYEYTAEAIDEVQTAEIPRKDLVQFLREHREVCMRVVQLLSEDLHVAYDRIRTVGLSRPRHVQPA